MIRKLSLKKYGTNDQPLLLDFDSNKTREPELVLRSIDLNLEGGWSWEAPERKRVLDKPDGYQEQVWIILSPRRNNKVDLEIGFSHSKWRFIKPLHWNEGPLPVVTPRFDSRRYCYKFECEEIESNLNQYGVWRSTAWIDLIRKLHSLRVLPRFPATLKIAGEKQSDPRNLEIITKLPSYSEFFLFINDLRII